MQSPKITVDPIIQKFIDALAAQGGTPIYKLPVHEARAVLDNAQKTSLELSPVDSEERTIPGGPHGSIAIRILRPHGNKNKLPVIVYIHGAGWVLGNYGTHERLVREIVHGAQVAMVFVEYRRAPEAPYPSIHEEGYTAAQWTADNAASLNLDASKMIIAGDSVGGLLATAIAQMAIERKGPKFMLQLLLYPVTNARFDTQSYQQFADGPWLTKPAMEWFWDNYVPNKNLWTNHLVSPLQASLDLLKHMPRTLIITNEYDVLRDEAEAYAHKLMQAGVPTTAVRYLGVIHDSAMLNAITNAPAIRSMIAQVNQTIRDVVTRSS